MPRTKYGSFIEPSRYRDRGDDGHKTAGDWAPEVFALVTGCPRSGTSALIHWLAADANVRCFNESRVLIAAAAFARQVERFQSLAGRRDFLLNELRQLVLVNYVAQLDRLPKVLVEKEPLEPIAFPGEAYGRFLEHVRRLIPDSKLLIIVREPVATIWSITNRLWGYSRVSKGLKTTSVDQAIRLWLKTSDVALSRLDDDQTYVCLYENLIADPENESRSISSFLSTRPDQIFQPRQTQKVHFSDAQLETIVGSTSGRWAALKERLASSDSELA